MMETTWEVCLDGKVPLHCAAYTAYRILHSLGILIDFTAYDFQLFSL